MAPVTVAERDYLEQDPPVRGQNYACMSFLSPEEAIASKSAFAMGKFTDRFAEELSVFLGKLGEAVDACGDESSSAGLRALKERFGYMLSGSTMSKEYDTFVSTNDAAISKEYSEVSDGVACVRGIKIRGCYETLDEARHRCEALKRSDPKFSVYVAEVGCWCPWSPNPDELAEAVGDQNVAQYSEVALNTLMKKYQENVDERDQFYIDRKRALVSMGKKAADTPSDGDSGEGSGAATGSCGDAFGSPAGLGGMTPDHEDRRRIMADLEAEDGWSQAKMKGTS
jgi:hypothetical protein